MQDNSDTPNAQNPFTSLPVEVVVSVGKARPAIGDLMNLGENAVIKLDRRVEDPVELYISDRLIARGELEELGGDQKGLLAVRLTEIIDVQSELS
jgi:flagellar motor switch protein FliN/FliY